MATTTMTPEAYEAYIRKNEGWNFLANFLDLTFYNLAISFIYGSHDSIAVRQPSDHRSG